MIIIRKKSKSFSNALQEQEAITSRELQIEQLRMQREIMETQKMKEKLKAEEAQNRLRQQTMLQKMEQKKDQEESKNQIKVKKLEVDNSSPENVSLYKTRSRVITPIPMQ